jgi:glycosyltransferase involved in cell wall biosynthesis
VRRRHNIPAEATLIASIARFAPQKDHETFFRAAAQVARVEREAHFLVAGYEAERSVHEIERIASAYPELEGRWHLWNERLADGRMLVRACDIGVVHSLRSEAICRVALEYMAESIPLVGTRVGALAEVIHEWHSGLLVPPADAGSLAGALVRLVRSPSLRQRLGAGGNVRLERSFSVARAVERTERVLQRYAR